MSPLISEDLIKRLSPNAAIVLRAIIEQCLKPYGLDEFVASRAKTVGDAAAIDEAVDGAIELLQNDLISLHRDPGTDAFRLEISPDLTQWLRPN